MALGSNTGRISLESLSSGINTSTGELEGFPWEANVFALVLGIDFAVTLDFDVAFDADLTLDFESSLDLDPDTETFGLAGTLTGGEVRI